MTPKVLEKISAWQFFLLLISLLIATSIVVLPGVAANRALHDAWLTPFIAVVPGVIAILLNISLGQRFPEKTIIQYSVDIAGPYFGRTISLFYLFFLIHFAALIAQEFVSLLNAALLIDTPALVLLVSLILVTAYSVHLGMEVIARVNELLLPLLIFSLIFMLLLIAKDVHLDYIKPVLGHGIINPLRGALAPSAWVGEVALLHHMLPFVINRQDTKKYALAAVFISALLLSLITVATIGVFGPYETGRLEFPIFSLVRVIEAGRFLERVDPAIMTFWVAGIFVKFSLFYFFATLAGSQLFGLKNYRPLTLPMGLIIGTLSLLLFNNVSEITEFFDKVFPFYALLLPEIGLPLLLLIIALLLRKEKPGDDSENSTDDTVPSPADNNRILNPQKN